MTHPDDADRSPCPQCGEASVSARAACSCPFCGACWAADFEGRRDPKGDTPATTVRRRCPGGEA